MIRALLISGLLVLSISANAANNKLLEKMQLVNVHGEIEKMSTHIGNGQWVVVNTWSPTDDPSGS